VYYLLREYKKTENLKSCFRMICLLKQKKSRLNALIIRLQFFMFKLTLGVPQKLYEGN